jgi:2OG-Fe(II) oxygenase superfamily
MDSHASHEVLCRYTRSAQQHLPAGLTREQFAQWFTVYEAACRDEGVVVLRTHVGFEDGRATSYRATAPGREYLMDPHVDGQLLTFIAHNEQGLAIKDAQGAHQVVNFGPDEIFVMAGALLEAASDGEIRGVSHAVTEVKQGAPRQSVMYFLNPEFSAAPYRSFVHQQPVNFLALANIIHQRFGNTIYHVSAESAEPA